MKGKEVPKYLVTVSAVRTVRTDIVVDARDDEEAADKALDLVRKDRKWSLSWDVVDDERVIDPQVDDIVDAGDLFPLTEL